MLTKLLTHSIAHKVHVYCKSARSVDTFLRVPAVSIARRPSSNASEIVSMKLNYCSVNRLHIKCNSTVMILSFTSRSYMAQEFGLH